MTTGKEPKMHQDFLLSPKICEFPLQEYLNFRSVGKASSQKDFLSKEGCLISTTPPKFNTATENDGWKTSFLWKGNFSGAMLNFRSV